MPVPPATKSASAASSGSASWKRPWGPSTRIGVPRRRETISLPEPSSRIRNSSVPVARLSAGEQAIEYGCPSASGGPSRAHCPASNGNRVPQRSTRTIRVVGVARREEETR
jgi:hypothetical protein